MDTLQPGLPVVADWEHHQQQQQRRQSGIKAMLPRRNEGCRYERPEVIGIRRILRSTCYRSEYHPYTAVTAAEMAVCENPPRKRTRRDKTDCFTYWAVCHPVKENKARPFLSAHMLIQDLYTFH
ncbi:hypothetical protein GWI33_011397 [Rhynchophorus ferrugineus]|uniref:Uncharacterized protein n=1 Tax=Rhynchophorus ferrugineus TaxID=354439 RepID=A0A834MIQ7_RHYFE|nr:hypothetical protein GWI33_011397 [Rhynchophorus ferrugineus]